MKLTLRTLLAFLDGTMNEDDAASLRKKIRESEAIRELVQRIRHVISQPQLPAPKSSTKGMTGDPNSSSEYIDSSLDLERVAEFEKMTIGSDMLLAEVAEAHQILANLAEIDEGVSGRLRNRLYKTTESIYKSELEEPDMFPVVEDHASIQEEYDDVDVAQKKTKSDFVLAPPRIDSEEDDPSTGFGEAPPVQAPPVEKMVTDTLGDSQFDAQIIQPRNGPRKNAGAIPTAPNIGDQKPARVAAATGGPRPKLFPVILATACITALIVLLVVSFMYPPNNQLAENQNDSNAANENSGDEGKQDETVGTLPANPDGDSTSESKVDDESKKPGDNQENAGKNSDGKTNPDGTELFSRNLDGKPDSNDDTPDNSQDEDPNENKLAKKEEKAEVLNLFRDKDYDDGKKSKAGKSPEADKSGKAVAMKPGAMKSGEAKPVAMKSGEAKPGEAAKSADPLKKEKNPSRMTDTRELMAEAAKLANGDPVGALKSALQPTLRKTNLPEAQWINLAQEQPIFTNDTIVALPGCQASLEILESVRVQLFGFSRIELQSNEGEVLPRVKIQNGIAAFDNLQDPNNTIDISVSGKNIQVTFVDKNSRFAVVRQEHLSSKGSGEITQVAALTGRILCKFDGKVASLDPNKLINFKGDSFENVPFKSSPPVMSLRPSTLTKSAKESFFALGLENPLFSVAVRKAQSDSRPYVRKFALISNLALGDFDSLIQFLNDEQNRSFWRDAFLFARQRTLTDSTFRTGLKVYCQNSAAAAPDKPAVRNWKNPSDGKKLFQFLTVTSDEVLENGLETHLVDGLQSKELWMRVASIQSLFSLTGKTKFFRAEDREEKRRKWVKAWEKSLEAGEIRISTPFQIQQFE